MTPPVLRGRAAFIFAEPNFDVDRIVGFEALRSHDPAAVAKALMRDFDPGFAAAVQPGDFLIGGRNFGYGHPHGPPMAAMRALGIAGVIAHSFAPLYLMGELAAGFPQVACPGVLEAVSRWDVLEVDWLDDRVRNVTTGRALPIAPLGEHARRLVEAGGLLPLLSRRPSPSAQASTSSTSTPSGPRTTPERRPP